MKFPKYLLFLFLLTYPLAGYGQFHLLPTCEVSVVELASAYRVPCPEGAYQLVFQDEFEGDSLDRSRWKLMPGGPAPWDRTLWHGCGRELQYYQEDNLEVADGLLKIIAREEHFVYSGIVQDVVGDNCEDGVIYEIGETFREEFDFTSAKIESADGFAVRPADNFIMEVRCKIPKGVGLWPAFWMWHHDEIDVFEFFGTERGCGTGGDRHFSATYHRENRGQCPAKFDFGYDLTRDFHTYAVEVTEWYIKWYFDGDLIRTASRLLSENGRWVSDQCGAVLPPGRYYEDELFPQAERYFRPILNLAIHQDCAGGGVTGLPAVFAIDYVRVYRRLPEAVEVETPDICNVYPNPVSDELTISLSGEVCRGRLFVYRKFSMKPVRRGFISGPSGSLPRTGASCGRSGSRRVYRK